MCLFVTKKNLLDVKVVFEVEAQIIDAILEEASGEVVDKTASKRS